MAEALGQNGTPVFWYRDARGIAGLKIDSEQAQRLVDYLTFEKGIDSWYAFARWLAREEQVRADLIAMQETVNAESENAAAPGEDTTAVQQALASEVEGNPSAASESTAQQLDPLGRRSVSDGYPAAISASMAQPSTFEPAPLTMTDGASGFIPLMFPADTATSQAAEILGDDAILVSAMTSDSASASGSGVILPFFPFVLNLHCDSIRVGDSLRAMFGDNYAQQLEQEMRETCQEMMAELAGMTPQEIQDYLMG